MYQIAKCYHRDSLVLITHKTEPNNNNNNNKKKKKKKKKRRRRKQSDISSKRGDWNHCKITQTVPEHHNRKHKKLWDFKQQSYWKLHTYYGKC
jgi:hypothetical protein